MRTTTFDRARRAARSLAARFTREPAFVVAGVSEQGDGHFVKMIFKAAPKKQVPHKYNGVEVITVVDGVMK